MFLLCLIFYFIIHCWIKCTLTRYLKVYHVMLWLLQCISGCNLGIGSKLKWQLRLYLYKYPAWWNTAHICHDFYITIYYINKLTVSFTHPNTGKVKENVNGQLAEKVGLQGASSKIIVNDSIETVKLYARSAQKFRNCCPLSRHKLYRTKGMV